MKTGSGLPNWAKSFYDVLEVKKNKLYVEGLPVLMKNEKHNLCKHAYFNPKMPSAPRAIYDKFESKYANLTRSDCINALKSLETYQRLSRRLKPKQITGNLSVNYPGVTLFIPPRRMVGRKIGRY